VVIRFAAPHSLFLQHLAGLNGEPPTRYPRHYLEQFHAAYNDDVDALAAGAGVADWVSLFTNRSNLWQNVDLPRLHGWILATAYDGTATRVVAERNPYYWKVDSEGNQLPYIDRVLLDVFGDAQVLLLRALAGEIDFYDRHIATLTNRPVLADNTGSGDYRFYDVIHSSMNTGIIALNLTHPDPVKRETYQNRDFRVGLSYAIDRQEIIDLLFLGLGEPWQAAPQRDTPFFSERLATQYTTYDPELAVQYLDAAFPEKDASGFRLGPDGRRITVIIEVPSFNSDGIDALQIVQANWNAVGVDTQVRTMDRSLFETRREANELDASLWQGDGGLMDAMLDPRWYLPYNDNSMFAVAWGYWRMGDARGEEPPAIVRQQMALFEQLGATASPEAQHAIMAEILDIAAEQFYGIGISLPPRRYGIARNDLRNVPPSMPGSGGPFPNPGPTNPEQFFFDRSAR